MVFEFTIDGVPVAKGRPRVCKNHTYTPQRTKDYESLIEQSWCIKYGNLMPSDKPIKAYIKFYMPIPKSISKKKAAELVGKPHTKKPDTDNLIKSILDGLNGLAFNDDSQVYFPIAKKVYGDKPKAVVWLSEEDDAT